MGLLAVQLEEWTMACTELLPYLRFGIGTAGTDSFAQNAEWNAFSVGSASHLPHGSGSRHWPGHEYVHCTEIPLLGTAEGNLRVREPVRQCRAKRFYGSSPV